MKSLIILPVFFFLFSFNGLYAQKKVDPQVLIGTWKIDMSPEDKTDNNFAMMSIMKIEDNSFEGSFYGEGVKIHEGRLASQLGTVYGALISGDGNGEYNSSFYYKGGKLYGTTHAIEREFLAVWIATKVK